LGEIPSSLPAPTFPENWFCNHQEPDKSCNHDCTSCCYWISSVSGWFADGYDRRKHPSNSGTIATGAAKYLFNYLLFGGIPANGAIAKTATNIKKCGKKLLSRRIVHALFFYYYAFLRKAGQTLIPMPTLPAILIVVAYNNERVENRSPKFSNIQQRVNNLNNMTSQIFDLTICNPDRNDTRSSGCS